LLEITGIEEESLDFEEGSKEDLMSPPELPTSNAIHGNSSYTRLAREFYTIASHASLEGELKELRMATERRELDVNFGPPTP
jgi:hypothetical protein